MTSLNGFLKLQHCQLNSFGNGTDCTTCFFPQNCISNFTCLLGTKGDTCEQCFMGKIANHEFYRLGNSCVLCDAVPMAVIGFGIYILLLSMASVTNGFNSSLCTKLKLICHFLQLLYLTFLIKIKWPLLTEKTISALSFVTFNSNIIPLQCILPFSLPALSIHYLEWTSTFLLVIAVVIITLVMDRSMGLVIKREEDFEKRQKAWRHRSNFRRLIFLVIVVMYMPVSVSTVHTLLCSGMMPLTVTKKKSEDVFLYLQDQTCKHLIFQNLQFFGAIFLVFYVLLVPLLVIFISLRQRKWNLLSATSHQFGYGGVHFYWRRREPGDSLPGKRPPTFHKSLYESYLPRCCFWEAVPMVRKVISIAVTDAAPISAYLQSLCLLGSTGIYLVIVFILRPYRPIIWRSRKLHFHIAYEVGSNMIVAFMQGIPIIYHYGLYVPSLDFALTGCVGLTLLLGIIMVLLTPMEKTEEQEFQGDQEENENQHEGILKRNNKVAPHPMTFEEEIEKKKKNLEF